jgi:hypothetical protein
MPFRAPLTERRLRRVEKKNIIALQGSYNETDHLKRGVHVNYNELGEVKVYMGAYSTDKDVSCCVLTTKKFVDLEFSTFQSIVQNRQKFETMLDQIGSKVPKQRTFDPIHIDSSIYVQIVNWADKPKINIRRWINGNPTVEGILLTPAHFGEICASIPLIHQKVENMILEQLEEISREQEAVKMAKLESEDSEPSGKKFKGDYNPKLDWGVKYGSDGGYDIPDSYRPELHINT